MLRPLLSLPALAAVAVTLAPAATADPGDRRPPPVSRPAAAVKAVDDSPLAVSIDALSPSSLPARDPVLVTGSVTNRTEVEWRAVNVHAFLGATPITTTEDLAEQSALGPAEEVGNRITEPGTFDNVGTLPPGESAQFSLRVRRSALGVSEAGVYWFGVHALGEGDGPRDGSADGRARTFLPLVPRIRQQVETALVVPVRHEVRHAEDGSIADVGKWAQDLDRGPLRALVDFGAAAGSRPLSWLVDPAVPDAVRSLVAGNPARSLDDTLATAEPDPDESGTPEPTPEPSPSEAATPAPERTDLPPNAATEPGTAWLERLQEAVRGDQVLTLPYGDLDVSAAAERSPGAYRQARRRSGAQLAPWNVSTTPAVSSPTGYLAPAALDHLPRRTTVLVTDRMFGEGAPAVARVARHRLLVASASAAEGGPGPDDPLAAVAVRQRILSEAALRLLEPGAAPLVVVLPSAWSPTSTTEFFEGLDVPWLDLTTLDSLDSPRVLRADPDGLQYPAWQTARELDAANFSSAEALVDAGLTLQNLLLRNDRVAADVLDEALVSLSHSARDRPDATRAAVDRSRQWILDRLASVSVRAPRAVTLSSSSGRFAATVTNELDHPVTVRVQAVSDRPMRVAGPERIEVAANSRTSVLLQATTRQLGVHNVQLFVTDLDGTSLGSMDALPIRSAQVSQVIWLILGTGVALLFGAIALRLVRRLRRSRS